MYTHYTNNKILLSYRNLNLFNGPCRKLQYLIVMTCVLTKYLHNHAYNHHIYLKIYLRINTYIEITFE